MSSGQRVAAPDRGASSTACARRREGGVRRMRCRPAVAPVARAPAGQLRGRGCAGGRLRLDPRPTARVRAAPARRAQRGRSESYPPSRTSAGRPRPVGAGSTTHPKDPTTATSAALAAPAPVPAGGPVRAGARPQPAPGLRPRRALLARRAPGPPGTVFSPVPKGVTFGPQRLAVTFGPAGGHPACARGAGRRRRAITERHRGGL